MPRWDISPGGVQQVITATGGVAAEFDGQVRTLESDAQGAAGQSGSGSVAGAVGEFMTAQTSSIVFVFTRTEACLRGAVEATNQYVAGDLEMAANAQAAAAAAPDPTATMPRGGGGGGMVATP
jgi:hypothetical protein